MKYWVTCTCLDFVQNKKYIILIQYNKQAFSRSWSSALGETPSVRIGKIESKELLPENKHKHDAVIRMGQEKVPKAINVNGFTWLKNTTSATTSPITNERNKKISTGVGDSENLHGAVQMVDVVKPRQTKHSSNDDDDDDDEVLYASDVDDGDMHIIDHGKTASYGDEGCNPEDETGASSKGHD